VQRVRGCTSLPVAVGLGVRDRAQAAEVAGFADGVIVGSAFVSRMLAAVDQVAAVAQVRELAADLSEGVRSRPAPAA
jgi:tryptophan synthase alpha chain